MEDEDAPSAAIHTLASRRRGSTLLRDPAVEQSIRDSW
jgi:hypothetical protein